MEKSPETLLYLVRVIQYASFSIAHNNTQSAAFGTVRGASRVCGVAAISVVGSLLGAVVKSEKKEVGNSCYVPMCTTAGDPKEIILVLSLITKIV